MNERELLERVDELVDQAAILKAREWATKALPILFACSEVLHERAVSDPRPDPRTHPEYWTE